MTEREALKMCLEYIETDAHERKYVRHAIKEALAQTEQETPKGWKSEIWKSVKQQEQESVTWGVDWGKAGDIPCVSIIKRVPNGSIEVMAVEYAPYSYTTPPQRTWVGLTEEDIKPFCDANHIIFGAYTIDFVKTIEQALREKNT